MRIEESRPLGKKCGTSSEPPLPNKSAREIAFHGRL